VEFAPGSGPVKVCEHCNTVVARGGDKLTVLGKAAELADTESPLSVGISGSYQGSPFTIAGRVQKDRGDGPWDEWCLSFEDQRTGWLAESEGQWNLMFPVPDAPVPEFKLVQAGNPITLKSHAFIVEERGSAHTVSAEGQLPSYVPEYDYVDATGTKGAFVSIEYDGSEGEAYIGSKVSLPELGFSKSDLSPTPRREALRQARCTQCTGPLELKAPDRTKRVVCPFCGAMLDVLGGKLEFLQLLEKPERVPLIPLGSKAKLPNKWARPAGHQTPGETEWTCLAMLERSCEVEGERYSWTEYLLFNHTEGFTWLMEANGHWSFLRPIPAADVLPGGNKASYGGKDYKLFQSVNTRTDYVLGECYWAVEKGEQAHALEFIAPPCSLNLDRTANEVSWTHAEIIDRFEIQKIWKLEGTPYQIGIAPGQLNPYAAKVPETWKWTALWIIGLLGVVTAFFALEPHGTLLEQSVTVPMGSTSGSPDSMTFSQPFELKEKGPVEISVSEAGLSNSWEGLQTDLVNQETLEVISLEFELSEYHGYEDGESWSETVSSQSKSTAALDKGTYVVRFTPSYQPGSPTAVMSVKVEAASVGFCMPFFLLLLMLGPPIFLTWRSGAFETQRWADAVRQTPYWREQ
jgi:hypothetical protein